METKSIEQVLESMDKSVVYKSKKSPLQAVLLIVAGLTFFIANQVLKSVLDGDISSAFIVAGALFTILGFAAFLFRKNNFTVAATKQVIKFSEFLFDAKERDNLVKMIQSGNLSQIGSLERSVNDGLKLRIAATPDYTFCLSQIVIFIPYEYTTVNAVEQHTSAQTKTLFEALREK